MYDESTIPSGTAPAHVLLVTSELIAQPITALLDSTRVLVSRVQQAAAVLPALQAHQPDLVLLDARSLEGNVLVVCEQARHWSAALLILVLLPTREMGHVLRMLDCGADDCLVAPFSPREVAVRLHVLLRRHAPNRAVRQISTELTLNLSEHRLYVQGKPIDLTPLEFGMLEALSRQVNQVMPRAELTAIAWGDVDGIDERLVDAHISRLRRKLQGAGLAACPIESVRGIGYICRTAPD